MYVLLELEEEVQQDLGIWRTFVSFDDFLNYQRNQTELDHHMATNAHFLSKVPMGEGGGAHNKEKRSAYSKKTVQYTNHIYVDAKPDYAQNAHKYCHVGTKGQMVSQEMVWYEKKSGYRQTNRREMFYWRKGFPNVINLSHAEGASLERINELKAQHGIDVDDKLDDNARGPLPSRTKHEEFKTGTEENRTEYLKQIGQAGQLMTKDVLKRPLYKHSPPTAVNELFRGSALERDYAFFHKTEPDENF